MLERLKKYDEIIKIMKSDCNISILELEIYYNIKTSYLGNNKNITNKDLALLVNKCIDAYLQSKNLYLSKIVYIALENIKELKNISSQELINKCY